MRVPELADRPYDGDALLAGWEPLVDRLVMDRDQPVEDEALDPGAARGAGRSAGRHAAGAMVGV